MKVKINNSAKSVKSPLQLINCQFEATKIYSITGSDARGAYTLLQILCGQKESEYVTFNQKKLSDYDIETYLQDDLSIISNEISLLQEYTVMENLEYTLTNFRTIKPEIIRLLSEFKLEKYQNIKASKLTFLEQKKLMIVRALCKQCKLLIAYHPTEGFLEEESKLVIDNLRKKRNQGVCVVLLTNDLELVLNSDVIYSLDNGYLNFIKQQN